MTKSAEAIIKPELLIWARKSIGMDTEKAAHKLGVSEDKLKSWEEGTSRPTIKQLLKAASVYKRPFAAFYLSKAPEVFIPPLKDYRRFPDRDFIGLSSEFMLDIRSAMDKREVYLEFLQEQGETLPAFEGETYSDKNPEEVGIEVRQLLGMTAQEQYNWKDKRIAFNNWREVIENRGVLVFQATKVQLSEMRGYSIAQFPLPVITVNRKDAYAGRTFSMLHEFVHLMLRLSGICDLEPQEDLPLEEKKIEVFCNHVAGAALVPQNLLLNEPSVISNQTQIWEDAVLESLEKRFSVSREVILRRLLLLGRTNQRFYETKRKQFQKEYEMLPKPKGFAPPSTNLMSATGKPFVRLMLEAYYTDRITTSDLSDYLGVKVKHLEKIGDAVGVI